MRIIYCFDTKFIHLPVIYASTTKKKKSNGSIVDVSNTYDDVSMLQYTLYFY